MGRIFFQKFPPTHRHTYYEILDDLLLILLQLYDDFFFVARRENYQIFFLKNYKYEIYYIHKFSF